MWLFCNLQYLFEGLIFMLHACTPPLHLASCLHPSTAPMDIFLIGCKKVGYVSSPAGRISRDNGITGIRGTRGYEI